MQFSEQPEDHEESEQTTADRAAATSQSTWVSVAVNVVLSATQIIIGTLSKSQGLIADGIHSLSDLVADCVVLFASQRPDRTSSKTFTSLHSESFFTITFIDLKTHKIHLATILMMGGISPPKTYDLCVYEAELGDGWKGFIPGPANKKGIAFSTARASPTFGLALTEWINAQKSVSDF